MGKAFSEMGTFGKVVVIFIAACAVKECVQHIAETVRLNKEASSK